MSKHVAAAALAGAHREDWSDPFAVARRKWDEVPSGNDVRERSAELLGLSDVALLEHWEDARRRDTEGPGFGIRGWYHRLYRDLVGGKQLLDIGCGLGFSTITFAEYGAQVTFVDVIEDNLQVVRRVCGLKGINARYYWVGTMEDFAALPHDFEVVTSIGSLINAPLLVTAEEVAAILPHVADRARWLHFAYPRSRWVRDGWPPLWAWGSMTDGPGTPWMEWHDRKKVLSLFKGVRAEVLFECEWHGGDFNWFDLEITRGATG
ncbi:MAG: class I SAM-dependent methyltransferase [Acidimicrobiales bacterium]|jgi:SAM-dependent methyltransferase